MVNVQALFVDPDGIYPKLLGAENCWDEARDARLYAGPDPVVAHPPCNLWVNMAAVNWKRYGKERPAWYRGGDDGDRFARALDSVRKFGGVLEHPAMSHAWLFHGLRMRGLNRDTGRYTREDPGWMACGQHDGGRAYTCEVWQSAYGNKCAKATWLYFVGIQMPPELDWRREPGTHQVGWFDRKKPTVCKRRRARRQKDSREN